jgi:hypothetical protein
VPHNTSFIHIMVREGIMTCNPERSEHKEDFYNVIYIKKLSWWTDVAAVAHEGVKTSKRIK